MDVGRVVIMGVDGKLAGGEFGMMNGSPAVLAPYAYHLSHYIKLLCNFRVSVKVNHSTLVYIVYYNVKLLALIIYKCKNYITLYTSYIFIL